MKLHVYMLDCLIKHIFKDIWDIKLIEIITIEELNDSCFLFALKFNYVE